MKYPCVMDIKIGRDRSYPGRPEEKIKKDAVSLTKDIQYIVITRVEVKVLLSASYRVNYDTTI